jgi:hypothetical protein
MLTLYDNVRARFLDGIRSALESALSRDLCIGYFFLRGWQPLSPLISRLSAPDRDPQAIERSGRTVMPLRSTETSTRHRSNRCHSMRNS